MLQPNGSYAENEHCTVGWPRAQGLPSLNASLKTLSLELTDRGLDRGQHRWMVTMDFELKSISV